MIERTQHHIAGDETLFNKVLLNAIQAINDDGDTSARLTQVLGDIRDFFFFGSAFVYEANPSRQMILHEHASILSHNQPIESFALEMLLDPEQIMHIVENPWCCADLKHHDNPIKDIFCEFFNTQSMFAVFLVDDADTIIGCVGMCDKRKHSPFSDVEFFQAKAALGLIAERSRFRIYKQRLEYTGATLENIMDHLGFDIYVNDFYTHEMLYANESMAAPYGGWENMKGKTCHEALYVDRTEECSYCPRQKLLDDEGNPSKVYTWDYQRPFDGKWFRVISAAFEWTDGRLAQVISSSDINEAKRNELLVHRMAFFDSLTGIGNRRKLEQDLKELLSQPQMLEKGISVLFLDLDNFKAVNDTYGHSGGDALLKHISALFQDNPSTADRCYRYGGDEFIFLFENSSLDDAIEQGRQLIALLETPIEFEGDTITSTASFGVAHYPEDGDDYWKLLDRADDAMYTEKIERKRSLS